MASFIPVPSHLPHSEMIKKAVLSGNPAFSATYICPWSPLVLFVGDTLFSSLLRVSLGLTAATRCSSECAGNIEKSPTFLKLNWFFSQEMIYRLRDCAQELQGRAGLVQTDCSTLLLRLLPTSRGTSGSSHVYTVHTRLQGLREHIADGGITDALYQITRTEENGRLAGINFPFSHSLS